jgi:RING-box protein 1
MGDTEMDVSMEPESAAAVPGPSSSSGSSAKRPKRFEIKKWNAVALWAWGASLIFFLLL